MNHSYFASSVLAAACALPALLYTGCAPQEQHDAAQEAAALVRRVTPGFAGRVIFRIDPQCGATPLLSAEGGRLCITAADGAEAARAYGYYLREIAGIHLSQNGDNATAGHFVLPQQPVTVPATRPFNYALNYCTLSYSSVYWDAARWTRELDLMALSGYKYVLVTAGLEQVWYDFLLRLGYPQRQIDSFIANPVFSAWWNMGNLEGEGGPLHPAIRRHEAALGRHIVSHIRRLGMEPVLQGYIGFLPSDTRPSQVKGRLVQQGKWVGPYKRPAVLAPTATAFPELAALWYKLLEQQYGYRAKAFAGDLFHEGGNTEGIDLARSAAAVQAAMQKASPESRWFLQAWAHNPEEELLQGLNPKHTLLLMLDKDMSAGHDPYYLSHRYLKRPQLKDSGFPYVWCELSNFGGNHGLYGGLELLENLYPGAGGDMGKAAEEAVGIGMISEGVETNPLYYDLLAERINRPEDRIERSAFLHRYARARYGTDAAELTQALALLAESVYTPKTMREGCRENILCARPSLEADRVSTWSSPQAYYDAEKVEQAARLMLRAGQALGLDALPTFRYDMADVTRQVLADRAHVQLKRVHQAYLRGDAGDFRRETEQFLKLIQQTANVLRTSEYFLLGPYVAGAEAKGGSNAEARHAMRSNLLRLFSTWSKGNTSLNDYAHRQLAEMMEYYYLPRWQAYFADKAARIGLETPQQQEKSGGSVSNNGAKVKFHFEKNAAVDAIQDAFPESEFPLLTTPVGNVLEEAAAVLNQH